METLTARGISNIPSLRPGNLAPSHLQPIHCRIRPHFIRQQLGFMSDIDIFFCHVLVELSMFWIWCAVILFGLRCCPNLVVRSSSSEGTSTETTLYGKDEQEANVGIIVKDTRPDNEKEDYDTNQLNEGSQEGAMVNTELFKFLEKIDLKFDYQDTYSLLVVGGGGAFALWLAVAVVGAVDSIPLLPKVLELIGLGYTIWFSSRYLIFKENRDELFSKVQQIKQEVLGSKGD
ncbi:protein CURVATURE THYLAKOID 1D [Striga asiatica]|uniref:Protein CURVATURE THYLAKOID 1D n=1 Tax=Striga asiatica TaxID=4170 RepID=A0A5A7P079_STRAF|nr:protein CURVATURE THYLAKOID 1D [Striga asiatica]